MKVISKNQRPSLIALIIGLSLVSTPSFALSSTTSTTTSSATTTSCSKVAELQSTNNTALASKVAALQTDFSTRLSTIATNQTLLDTTVSADRTKVAADFESKIATLKQSTQLTTLKTAAVSTYETNVKKAEVKRESAVDAARSQYRSALSSSVTSHQSEMLLAAQAFQTSVKSGFTTAVANCGNGTAVTTLKSSVVSARQTLALARTNADNTAAIKQLETIRNKAIATADKTFAASVTSYTKILSAALKA